MRAKQVLERTGLPGGLFEAEDIPHVALHPGEVERLAVDLLRRGEEALRARVIEDVTPIFGALWSYRVTRTGGGICGRKVESVKKRANINSGGDG